MEIHITPIAGTLRVRPVGAVDSHTAGKLEQPLLEAIAEVKGTVELDCADVPYMSSAGLRVLVLAAKQLREHDAKLRLINVSPSIQTVLKVANFTAFVDLQ